MVLKKTSTQNKAQLRSSWNHVAMDLRPKSEAQRVRPILGQRPGSEGLGRRRVPGTRGWASEVDDTSGHITVDILLTKSGWFCSLRFFLRKKNCQAQWKKKGENLKTSFSKFDQNATYFQLFFFLGGNKPSPLRQQNSCYFPICDVKMKFRGGCDSTPQNWRDFVLD